MLELEFSSQRIELDANLDLDEFMLELVDKIRN
jgi:hypothetical protein